MTAIQIAIVVDNMRSHDETETLKARFEAEAVYLQEEIKTEHNFEEIIGQSAPVRELLRKIEQAAPTEATVLILSKPRLLGRRISLVRGLTPT
jgi:formate hydrogenlyase transcriptional activator